MVEGDCHDEAFIERLGAKSTKAIRRSPTVLGDGPPRRRGRPANVALVLVRLATTSTAPSTAGQCRRSRRR